MTDYDLAIAEKYEQAIMEAQPSGQSVMEIVDVIHRVDEELGWDGQSYVNFPFCDHDPECCKRGGNVY